MCVCVCVYFFVFFLVIHIFSLLIDNEFCIRTPNLLIQAEFCHFSQEFSDSCAAPFSRFLCNEPDDIEHFTLDFTQCANRHINQTHNLCRCGYRGGRRECIPCELHNGRTTVMHVIHMCAHMCECSYTQAKITHTHKQRYMHTCTHTHTHTRMHTPTQHTHTHTHTTDTHHTSRHRHKHTHVYECYFSISF